jgi:hypothetical protein
MSGDTFVVSELYVSHATAQKLLHKHQITVQEVEDAVVNEPGLRGSWDNDPIRGLRMLVEVTIRGRRALVVLYPRDDPTEWNLGSGYFQR